MQVHILPKYVIGERRFKIRQTCRKFWIVLFWSYWTINCKLVLAKYLLKKEVWKKKLKKTHLWSHLLNCYFVKT